METGYELLPFSMPSPRRSRRIASRVASSTNPPNLINIANSTTEPSFESFPKLPMELQNQIWHFAIAGEHVRVHRMAPDIEKAWETSPGQDIVQFKILSMAYPVPPCLRTCSNSRRISKRTYTLWPLQKKSCFVWVNKEVDLLYLTDISTQKYWFIFENYDDYSESPVMDPDTIEYRRIHQTLQDLLKQFDGIYNIAFDRDRFNGCRALMKWLLTLSDAVNWTIVSQDYSLDISTSWVLQRITVDRYCYDEEILKWAQDQLKQWVCEGKDVSRLKVEVFRALPMKEGFKRQR